MPVIAAADRPAPAGTFDELVAERVAELRRRVAALAGERPVTIVAVTKGFGPGAPQAAARAGVADVGENYGQELVAKAASLAGEHLRWHFLGAVQRRKVRALAPLVDLWQSVDREAAGVEIASAAPGARVLVQVNVSGLPGRNGCSETAAPALVDRLRVLGLDVQGLMAVASPTNPRPEFRRLSRLAADLGLSELSMGMTGDLEVALEEGATLLRLGRALFGPRPVPDSPGERD